MRSRRWNKKARSRIQRNDISAPKRRPNGSAQHHQASSLHTSRRRRLVFYDSACGLVANRAVSMENPLPNRKFMALRRVLKSRQPSP